MAFIFVSPLLGMLFGALLMLAVSWIFVKSTPSKVDRWFRRLQLISASLYSLGHGGNDAQKTIGIIWMLLIGAGYLGTQDPVPIWVIVACYIAIALGTAFGGRRIVKIMGQRITKLRPVGGCCAETGIGSRCSSRPASAFRSRPRIPSPAPSSAWAPRSRPAPCAGAWPATSSGPGS